MMTAKEKYIYYLIPENVLKNRVFTQTAIPNPKGLNRKK